MIPKFEYTYPKKNNNVAYGGMITSLACAVGAVIFGHWYLAPVGFFGGMITYAIGFAVLVMKPAERAARREYDATLARKRKYDQECLDVKWQYREGKLTMVEATRMIERLGDKHRLPPEWRVYDLDIVTVRQGADGHLYMEKG